LGATAGNYFFRLKHYWFIQLAALRTAGAIHVGVIGIDEATLIAAEDAILGMRRAKVASPHFGINSHHAQYA
jgi:hypothetical protein